MDRVSRVCKRMAGMGQSDGTGRYHAKMCLSEPRQRRQLPEVGNRAQRHCEDPGLQPFCVARH
jgi:hypothetical protein